MTATKKSLRFLTVLALIFAMVFSIMTVPASAAGTETWYGDYVREQDIHIERSNLTYPKTMGVAGTLKINGTFTFPEGVNLVITPLTFILQIQDGTGRILAEDRTTKLNAFAASLNVEYSVYYGQRVHIYSCCQKASGEYVPVTFSYSHQIT